MKDKSENLKYPGKDIDPESLTKDFSNGIIRNDRKE
jgi:hypothetical protein